MPTTIRTEFPRKVKGIENFWIPMPGGLIHHEPFESHSMKTFSETLLAAWIWIGEDVTYKTYRID